MPGLRDIAVRWYRRAFGAPAGSDIRDEGLDTVLDGNTAVALCEAGIASHAVLGASYPSAAAESAWLGQHGNLFGEALSTQSAEGPRGIVAAATGLALTGRRATAFLSGPDIAAAQDLLISAAGKHVPLVLHLATRAATAHGTALGSGHDSVHMSADTGVFVLVAANVQEAVDFSYIARRVTEASLVPGIVVMDGEQTALSVQDVRLPSPDQVRGFLGSARDLVDAPTEAQRLLFGEARRRVPAWHDLHEPVLTGALFGPGNFALGAFARGPYFDAHVRDSLAESFEQFAGVSGRRYEPVSRYRLDDAKIVLLAQGAAIETARVAADWLRKSHNARVGVVGVHALRPFPATEIVDALADADRVFVLERVDTPLSGEPPLTRELRSALLRESCDRQCDAVVYGVGGLPLRVADLAELCTGSVATSPVYLGLDFDDPSGEQPKREVLLDALRRAYPGVADKGVRAAASDFRPEGTLTIEVRHGRLGGTVAGLMQQLEGGRIRSRQASTADVEQISHGGDSFEDPGDELIADVSVDRATGTIVLRDGNRHFHVPLDHDGDELDDETLLGGLFGVLAQAGLLDAKQRRIIKARHDTLDDIEAARRERLLTAFRGGIEQFEETEASPDSAPQRWEGDVPAAVRHLARDDDHYASLPRFWDQAGVLYRDGMPDRLTAGPYLATGVIPPLSSTFNDLSVSRQTLPVLDPTLCTGCGKCWTHCPDSAIGVAALTPAALIEAGINLTGADAVRQVASKIASRIVSTGKTTESTTFGGMLGDAFAWLEDKLPDERREAIREGVEKIDAALGALPIAVTQPFFHDLHDKAELLSLAINPDACKECGICSASCEPGALQAAEQTAERLHDARNAWSTWTNTPDTASESLERVFRDAEPGKLTALLLSRYCQFALAGGDTAEPGSGARMAVRLILSATEFHQQPVVQRFAESLAEAGEQVSTLIRETLSGAFTVDDLDAMTEQLRSTTSPRVDLKSLAGGDRSVDTDYLLRLIDLSKRIENAHYRIVRGEHGLGRARCGLVVAGGDTAAWAGAFPHNPFQAPVLIDMSGDGPQLAAGLIEGHLDETTELVRLLRLARLEVEQPDGADWKREALTSLHWQDLDDEEYELCPPLVLVGTDEVLGGAGLGQLTWLVNSGLPVKVLVLQSLDSGLAESPAKRVNPGLVAVAQRNAYVAQSSIADPVHLGESLLEALAYDGPAVLLVYAASPDRDGFASDCTLEQSGLAVTSRAMPLYRYDPTAAGVFGTRLSLDGNPLPHEVFVPDGERCLTAADWAFGQRRFSTCFRPLPDDAATPTPLPEWLLLDERGRSRKTPYVVDGEQRYAMTPAMLDMAEQCVETWRMLQELAGVVTPFTELVEEKVRADVAAEHQEALDAQQKASDEQIRTLRAETEAEIAGKIRSRLLQLASRKRS